MPLANEVAQYFLTLVDEESGDLMTNLKLQKLLYYAQGWYLALYHRPLFHDPIEAWLHGPVVPSVYRQYSEWGSQPISRSEDFDPDSFDSDMQSFLNEVYEVYGQFSAWKLRNMTHEEEPWLKAQQGHVISLEVMERFFQTQVAHE